MGNFPGPMVKKRRRYRKMYPGESKGITEEMRFVAMRLRTGLNSAEYGGDDSLNEEDNSENETWIPTIEGFLKYLVDSKVVFDTLEGIIDRSDDVSYAHFRKTGLERSECLSRDIEAFSEQGLIIPEPNSPGTCYAAYLKERATSNVPCFLTHLYNIYFAHVTGGVQIGKQVSEKLLEGRKLEFYKWEGDVMASLKDVREKLNKVGEHWSRDEKNRCLRETPKCFRLCAQIVRLIIL